MPALNIPFLRKKPSGPFTGQEQHPVTDWTQNLVLFFRILAVLQVLKGMVHWGLLLSTPDLQTGQASGEFLAANIYFAVLDPVATDG